MTKAAHWGEKTLARTPVSAPGRLFLPIVCINCPYKERFVEKVTERLNLWKRDGDNNWENVAADIRAVGEEVLGKPTGRSKPGKGDVVVG